MLKNRCCFCFKSHTSSSGSQISLSLIHRKNILHITTFSYTNTSQPSMKQHLPLLPVSMLMFTIPFYFTLFFNCLSWFQDLVMCCNPTVWKTLLIQASGKSHYYLLNAIVILFISFNPMSISSPFLKIIFIMFIFGQHLQSLG